jgi:hypothetical protein
MDDDDFDYAIKGKPDGSEVVGIIVLVACIVVALLYFFS